MLTVPRAVEDAIVAHAERALPEECCGLLLGRHDTVVEVHQARNIASDPRRRYLVDPHDHLAAIRRARDRGLEVLGGYHSHPQSLPTPSQTDAAEGFGHFLFVIVGRGPRGPEMAAWMWVDGNFTRVPLVRVP